VHQSVVEPAGYKGELSVVADRWRGKEHMVIPMFKDGLTPIDGLTPRGIAFISVEEFPLRQVADFVAWAYSRLELTLARGVDALNKYKRREFDLLT
jgi:hypothetical protein